MLRQHAIFWVQRAFLRRFINYTIRLKEVDVAITVVIKGIEKDLAKGLSECGVYVFNADGHGGF